MSISTEKYLISAVFKGFFLFSTMCCDYFCTPVIFSGENGDQVRIIFSFMSACMFQILLKISDQRNQQ